MTSWYTSIVRRLAIVVLLSACTDSATCPASCPSGSVCVEAAGECLRPCSDDSACAGDEICVRGYCTIGNRPPYDNGRHGDPSPADGAPGDALWRADWDFPYPGDFSVACVSWEYAVTIQTQADVDAFDGRCFFILGRLRIEDTPVTNLDGLHGLWRVMDSTTVTGNPDLTSLGGLAGVDTANGVTIDDNATLSTLGLTRLRNIHGNLTITNNPMLPAAAAEALLAQVTVMGQVTVENNGP